MGKEIHELLSIFDRAAVRTHRDRAATMPADHNFLVRVAANGLLDRLDDVTRNFPFGLDVGCRNGLLTSLLRGRGGVQELVQSDLSWRMVRDLAPTLSSSNSIPISRVVSDDEAVPFALRSFDVVLSNLVLHWANDLPGVLVQLNRVLKPDGLFLATLFGGDTLWELRESLLQAETEVEAGASPRVSPFIDVRDAGDLLTRARFSLSVADADTVTVSYPNIFRLMTDLRGMGETNATQARRRTFTRRETLLRAGEIYHENHGGADGRIPATFQIITLTGWAPHESQPKPLRPGSAKLRMSDALGTTEQSASDITKTS